MPEMQARWEKQRQAREDRANRQLSTTEAAIEVRVTPAQIRQWAEPAVTSTQSDDPAAISSTAAATSMPRNVKCGQGPASLPAELERIHPSVTGV